MSEKVTAPFRMLRAVCDDAETAALAAAGEHLHQLDKLHLEVTSLTQENGELALEAARLRKQRNPNRTVVSNKDKVDDAGWVEAVATAIGLYYEYDGPFVAAESNVVVERIEQLKADSARLRHLANLDMMSLQMPDGWGAETIEEALRGWKTGYDDARAELAHVREQLASTLCVIEKATTEAANAVVYANVDTSLSDPRPGKLLVIRLTPHAATQFDGGNRFITFMQDDFVGWLEAAQDEGDTETKADASAASTPAESAANDVRLHARLEVEAQRGPVVRCGECTATVGHFPDCAKAVQP